MRISDWSSDVCSSDLHEDHGARRQVDAGEGDRSCGRSEQGLDRRVPAEDLLDGRSQEIGAGAKEAGLVGVGGQRCRAVAEQVRSEERRVGKECGSTGSSRWSPSLSKQTTSYHHCICKYIFTTYI